MLSDKEKSRYARQIKLKHIGESGQQKLLDSTALIIGMGGLGSPAAMYLAAAGVGKLIISDFDQVEDSNLQRQIIHRTQDVGEHKALSAKRTLAELNPDCEIEAMDWQLDDEELQKAIQKSDVVLDCSDNFPTRFAINRACVKNNKPLVSGAAIRMEGQIASYLPDADSPCYQCLYKDSFENTETCVMEGVLSPVVGVIGTMQALQTILILIGETENLKGKLMLFDGFNMEWQTVKVPKNPQCSVCSSS